MPYSLKSQDDLLVEDFKNNHSWQTVFDIWTGAWKICDLLRPYAKKIDGIEIHRIYVTQFDLERKYDKLYIWDVLQHCFLENYDVMVLGDVLEHIDKQAWQKLLEYLKTKCNTIYVQIPYLLEQWVEFNNIYETHLQADLTNEIFLERYPWFELMGKDFIIWLYRRSC